MRNFVLEVSYDKGIGKWAESPIYSIEGGGGSYKLLLGALYVFVLFSSQAKTEESGLFIGPQLMYGDLVYSEVLTDSPAGGVAQQVRYSSNNTGAGYGVAGGYKHFFSPYFGVRAYGSFFFNQFTFFGRAASFGTQSQQFPQAPFRLEGGKSSIYQFNLTANAEALFNVIVRERFNLGVFGGVGVGFQYWKSNRLDKMYQFHQTLRANSLQSDGKQEDRRFGIALSWSVGVRTNFLKVNTIEVGAVIPMFDVTIFDYESLYQNIAPITHNVKARQSYNAFVRYTFDF